MVPWGSWVNSSSRLLSPLFTCERSRAARADYTLRLFVMANIRVRIMQALIKCKILSVVLACCSVGGKRHGIRIKSREAALESLGQIRQNAMGFRIYSAFSLFFFNFIGPHTFFLILLESHPNTLAFRHVLAFKMVSTAVNSGCHHFIFYFLIFFQSK